MSTLLAPSRRIWIPPRRKVRWCPVHRRPVTNMAAGDRLLSATGNRLIGTTGNRKLSDGVACCCGGEVSYNCVSGSCVEVSGTGGFYASLAECQNECPKHCDNCTDGTNIGSSITVTFDAVDICACTQDANFQLSYKKIAELNGTYCLTQYTGFGGCDWIYTLTRGIIQAYDGDKFCTGTPSFIYDEWRIWVGRTNKWFIDVYHSSSSFALFSGSNASCSAVVNNSTGACGNAMSAMNGVGFPDPWGTQVTSFRSGLARNGTATISIGC